MANQPLFPVSIVRSQMILSSKKGKSLVSTSFLADFGKGLNKVLNLTKWVDSRLVIESEDTYLSNDVCVLYHLDWSNNPTFGTWGKNYPKSLLISNL